MLLKYKMTVGHLFNNFCVKCVCLSITNQTRFWGPRYKSILCHVKLLNDLGLVTLSQPNLLYWFVVRMRANDVISYFRSSHWCGGEEAGYKLTHIYVVFLS